MDELIQSTTAIVQSYFQDGEGGTNAILDFLDADPSWDNVSGIITTLAGIKNDSEWAIGEILAFIRYRSMYTPVAAFGWDGKDAWPDELFAFIREEFGHPLNANDAEIVEFLSWWSYRFDRFWLLVREGEIKVWREGKGAGLGEEDAFEAYVRKLGALISEIKDEKSLMRYYYTVMCFPRSKRIPDISMTTHYEVTNLAGNEVSDDLRGIARLEAKAPIAQQKLNEMRGDGRVTVQRVRAEQKKVTNEKRGFIWEIPLPPCLYVIDTNKTDSATHTGEKLAALDFSDRDAGMSLAIWAILFHAGIDREYPSDVRTLYMNGDRLETQDGELVAELVNMDKPLVQLAIGQLANKMGWKVKR